MSKTKSTKSKGKSKTIKSSTPAAAAETDTSSTPAAAADNNAIATAGPDMGRDLHEAIPPEWTPTEVLADILFSAWMSSLGSRTFHWMTRTFSHHRAGVPYDMEKIFVALDEVNGGDHAALLDQIIAFRRQMMSELRDRVVRPEKTE